MEFFLNSAVEKSTNRNSNSKIWNSNNKKMAAAGRVGAIGCIDEDAIATYVPLTAGEAAGGGIAVGGLGRWGGLVGNSNF